MTEIKHTKIVDILKSDKLNYQVNVMGWIRNCRISKNITFITLNEMVQQLMIFKLLTSLIKQMSKDYILVHP